MTTFAGPLCRYTFEFAFPKPLAGARLGAVPVECVGPLSTVNGASGAAGAGRITRASSPAAAGALPRPRRNAVFFRSMRGKVQRAMTACDSGLSETLPLSGSLTLRGDFPTATAALGEFLEKLRTGGQKPRVE